MFTNKIYCPLLCKCFPMLLGVCMALCARLPLCNKLCAMAMAGAIAIIQMGIEHQGVGKVVEFSRVSDVRITYISFFDKSPHFAHHALNDQCNCPTRSYIFQLKSLATPHTNFEPVPNNIQFAFYLHAISFVLCIFFDCI